MGRLRKCPGVPTFRVPAGIRGMATPTCRSVCLPACHLGPVRVPAAQRRGEAGKIGATPGLGE
ncbi:MAG: hypothetical protein EBT50_08665, partial [Verrucomicrobia bacterium]|nr:hypothetical protein [Verrucomicrobiota bacterium]